MTIMRIITICIIMCLILTSCSTSPSVFPQLEVNDPLPFEFNVEVSHSKDVWLDSNFYHFISVNVWGCQSPGLDYSKVNEAILVANDTCGIVALKLIHDSFVDSTSGNLKNRIRGLFLIDDFSTFSDSITVYYEAHYDKASQSSSEIGGCRKKIFVDFNRLIDSLPLDVDDPEISIANKRWYKTWRKQNTLITDLRTKLSYRDEICND